MTNFTHRWIQSGHFFPKLGHLFSNFQKRTGETSPRPPSSYAPDIVMKILTKLDFSGNSMFRKEYIIKNQYYLVLLRYKFVEREKFALLPSFMFLQHLQPVLNNVSSSFTPISPLARKLLHALNTFNITHCVYLYGMVSR